MPIRFYISVKIEFNLKSYGQAETTFSSTKESCRLKYEELNKLRVPSFKDTKKRTSAKNFRAIKFLQ